MERNLRFGLASFVGGFLALTPVSDASPVEGTRSSYQEPVDLPVGVSDFGESGPVYLSGDGGYGFIGRNAGTVGRILLGAGAALGLAALAKKYVFSYKKPKN